MFDKKMQFLNFTCTFSSTSVLINFPIWSTLLIPLNQIYFPPEEVKQFQISSISQIKWLPLHHLGNPFISFYFWSFWKLMFIFYMWIFQSRFNYTTVPHCTSVHIQKNTYDFFGQIQGPFPVQSIWWWCFSSSLI